MSDILLFWNAGPKVTLSPPEIARELQWGEEVNGLIDLPVKEIIDQLKAAFPAHEEGAGLLVGHGGVGTFEATWTWQFVKVDCKDLPPGDRQKLIDTIGCQAFDGQGKAVGG
jgi:hypothetical protein